MALGRGANVGVDPGVKRWAPKNSCRSCQKQQRVVLGAGVRLWGSPSYVLLARWGRLLTISLSDTALYWLPGPFPALLACARRREPGLADQPQLCGGGPARHARRWPSTKPVPNRRLLMSITGPPSSLLSRGTAYTVDRSTIAVHAYPCG